MRITEELGWPGLGIGRRGSEKDSPMALLQIEPPLHCAYNQTRECFLGLEVTAEDMPQRKLAQILSKQTLKSGEGLWLRPFHGIPTTGLFAPIDLIYLDEECRVLEAVESFPNFIASVSIPLAASVLVLPAHSIYSSQTQAGDQLVLCVAEEMEWRLERLAGAHEEEAIVQGAVLLREHPLWSGGPGVVEMGDRAMEVAASAPEPHEMSLIEPGIKSVRPPKNWLERWWSPDPRKAPLENALGLAAYYWNGTAPKAHDVRDISASGLYVVTEERWYPGTLVLMTLQRSGGGDEMAERSIQVMSRAVRWGNDGVGLRFVLPEEADLRKGKHPLMDGISKKEFARFLNQLRKSGS
jgi:hypothetical protein